MEPENTAHVRPAACCLSMTNCLLTNSLLLASCMIAHLASQTSQTDHVQLAVGQAAAVALVGQGLCIQPSPGQAATAGFAGKGPCREGKVL